MKRGGGSGGGASGSLEPGMDMGRRDEREEDVDEERERDGEGRDREKEKSVTEVELESQMRIDGGEVVEGYSIFRADIGGGGRGKGEGKRRKGLDKAEGWVLGINFYRCPAREEKGETEGREFEGFPIWSDRSLGTERVFAGWWSERGSSGGGEATAMCRMWTQLPRSRWIREFDRSQQETKTTCGAEGREGGERREERGRGERKKEALRKSGERSGELSAETRGRSREGEGCIARDRFKADGYFLDFTSSDCYYYSYYMLCVFFFTATAFDDTLDK
jgi:hypothetical protein